MGYISFKFYRFRFGSIASFISQQILHNASNLRYLKLTHPTNQRTSLNKWSARRIDLYLHNSQQTQETNIHALSGIRTRHPSN